MIKNAYLKRLLVKGKFGNLHIISVEKQANYGEGYILKKLLIFTLTALIIFQLSSCGVENMSETNKSEQMQETKSEEVNNSEISKENIKSQLAQFSVEKIPEWDYKVEIKESVEQKNVPFMESEKTLIYKETKSIPYSFNAIDYYIDKNTNEKFAFINGTNTFVSYLSYTQVDTEGNLLNEENLIEISKNTASKYIDISKYKCEVICPTTCYNHLKNEYFNEYCILFTKLLNGMKTNEYILIGINEYGVVFAITIYNEYLYNNCFIPEYDKEAAEKELLKKAIEECGLTDDQIAETKVEFQECRISAERKLMLVYNITFTLKSDIEAYPSVKSVELAVTIDADCYK